jgi:hypothetical protein
MAKVQRNKKTALRAKSLGSLGELLAIKVLVDGEFKNIQNLNDQKKNYPYADLYAERGNKRYIISVKARNKYDKNGKVNDRYKLNRDCFAKAQQAEKQFKAKAAWLAIPITDDTYSAYFGTLDLLNTCGIIMTEPYLPRYECLVEERPHNIDFAPYKNVYEYENKYKLPVVKGKRRNYFPTKPLCPVCGERKVLEPHSMASLTSGALSLLDKKEDIWGPSEDMRGYLDLDWHGAHDGGEGENRDIFTTVSLVRDVKGGQASLHFCSTNCLRQFLNTCVDELKTKIEMEMKSEKQDNNKHPNKKRR